MKKTNENKLAQDLANELTKNNTINGNGFTFHVNQVFGIDHRTDLDVDTVFIQWSQDIGGVPALTGMAGFYFQGKEMKVINFDSHTKPLCDLAGCSVEAIAKKVGCFTNYNRKNPDTFEVMYLN